MSCEENAGHYHSIKMGNKSFESMAKFKHLGTTLNESKLHEPLRTVRSIYRKGMPLPSRCCI